MITDLTKKIEKSEKDFFELMNNEFFRKTLKNLKKHRDIKLIKLVTTEARRNYLVSEPNYNATNMVKKTKLCHMDTYMKTDNI